jgi:hypothetical protein
VGRDDTRPSANPILGLSLITRCVTSIPCPGRHPIGRQVLQNTDRGMRMIGEASQLGFLVRLFRSYILPRLISLPIIRRQFLRSASQLTFNYRSSSIVEQVRLNS